MIRESWAVGLRKDRVSQGIFHCKAAKWEGLIWCSERHGERWWLQMSKLSEGEPGIEWSRRTRQEAESVWPGARRWVGLALVISLAP